MRTLILLFFAFAISHIVGQTYRLNITDINDNLVRQIKPGSSVKVITQTLEMSSGRIRIINDSTILIGKDMLSLNSIQQLLVPSKAGKVTGILLYAYAIGAIAIGSFVTLIGLIDSALNSDNTLLTTGLIMMSTAIPTSMLSIGSFGKKTTYSLDKNTWSIIKYRNNMH